MVPCGYGKGYSHLTFPKRPDKTSVLRGCFEPIADGHHGCLEYPRLDFTRVSHIHMPELHRPFG